MSSFLRSFRHWLYRNVSKMITSFALTEVDLIMMTSSNGNIFRVTGHLCGEFTGPRWIPAQRPATRSFDVFFDLRRIKWLNKQSWGWWFETLSFPLWRHCNDCFGSLKWRPFQRNICLTTTELVKMTTPSTSTDVFLVKMTTGTSSDVNVVKMTKLSFPKFWIQMLTSLRFIICRWPQQTHRILIGSSTIEKKKKTYRPVTWNISSIDIYPRPVLTFWYYRCPRRSLCVRQPRDCPCAHSSSVQARTTKLGQKTQYTVVKIPANLMVNWPWSSRSNLTLKSDITSFF